MNRTIKFRAWSKAGEEMIEWEQIANSSDNYLYSVFEGLKDCGHIFMQFTGLKDRNGVEIYEGDIIKSRHEEITVKYKIVWDEEQAGFMYEEKEWSKHQHSWPMTCDIAFLSEVIGNIYQNHELIS